MYSVELYNRVRRACHVEGMSKSEAARMFGIDRKTVSKILKHSVPPGYRRMRPPPRPKLDPFIPIIDQILEDDKGQLKKQRHTAKRIFERLRDEHGFTGGITIVTEYVREKKRRSREVFVPLAHPPGHAQADFGDGRHWERRRRRCLHRWRTRRQLRATMSTPHSDAFFIKAYPAETTEAFCDGQFAMESRHRSEAHGGRRLRVLRRRAAVDPLRQHHDRGGEDLRPLSADCFAIACRAMDGKRDRTRTFAELQSHYLFDDRFGRPGYAHHEVQVRGVMLKACLRHDVHEVVIGCGAYVIARHRRSYETADMVFDPMHFLPLLEQKIGALDQAAPLQDWDLPDAFATLHRLLEARTGKKGKREYVQVLRLLETLEMAHVHGAVRHALDLGAIGYDAVKHLVLCRVERRPPRLDLDIYPFLPRARVETTKPGSYMSLMSGTAR